MWERILEVSIVVGLLWIWSAYYRRGSLKDEGTRRGAQDSPARPERASGQSASTP